MFLNEINIESFRVLKDITLRFQTPESDTANPQNGNVINVIAGVNGTGKTSLLEAIYKLFQEPSLLERKKDSRWQSLFPLFGEFAVSNSMTFSNSNSNQWQKQILEYQNENFGQIIFLRAQQSFEYEEESKLEPSEFAQIVDSKKVIGRAEFYINEFIIKKERASNVSDPKERTKQAVDAFNAIFEDANLLTKLSDLAFEDFHRPVFENVVGKTVIIDWLSDGEKQLYARLIAVMILDPHDSIILIDEPEIALHPAWQQIIMKLYSRVGKNNQFIVATHSPQVIASVPYKNRIILHKENGKIVPIHCDQPPSGVDVNSILSEIMGADARDPKLLALYKKYRQFVEDGNEQTQEAKDIKSKLGEESEYSEFMQEMQFFIELRDA